MRNWLVAARAMLAFFGLSCAAGSAHAGWVNAFGVGAVTAAVWCKSKPPRLPTLTVAAAGAAPLAVTIPPPPLPKACTSGTGALAVITGRFSGNWAATAAAGDWAAASYDELFGLVTPVSTFAAASLDLIGTEIDSDTVMLDWTWSGTDQGTAGLLRVFDGASLIFEAIRVGAWSESASMTFDVSSIENVRIESDGLASSIPAPASLALIILGMALLGAIRLRARPAARRPGTSLRLSA